MKTYNELIAEFMGGTLLNKVYKKDRQIVKTEEHGNWYLDDLKYDTSWDWLMPVCQKISSKPIVIHKNGGESVTDWINAQRAMKKGAIRFDMGMCYNGVVEFIKWYNSQPK